MLCKWVCIYLFGCLHLKSHISFSFFSWKTQWVLRIWSLTIFSFSFFSFFYTSNSYTMFGSLLEKRSHYMTIGFWCHARCKTVGTGHRRPPVKSMTLHRVSITLTSKYPCPFSVFVSLHIDCVLYLIHRLCVFHNLKQVRSLFRIKKVLT